MTKQLRVADLTKLAAGIVATGCDRVTKEVNENTMQFNFSGPSGQVIAVVQKRQEDQYHQLIRLSVIDRKVAPAVSYEATANDGERLDVHPVLLSEFYRAAMPFGKAVARLLQSAVVADGATCHLEKVRGHLQQLAKAA